MLAICHMETEAFNDAITAFGHVKPESSVVFAMQYYKALCLIKMNKNQEAADLLVAIKNQDEHPYRRNARKLLRMLKHQ